MRRAGPVHEDSSSCCPRADGVAPSTTSNNVSGWSVTCLVIGEGPPSSTTDWERRVPPSTGESAIVQVVTGVTPSSWDGTVHPNARSTSKVVTVEIRRPRTLPSSLITFEARAETNGPVTEEPDRLEFARERRLREWIAHDGPKS